MWYAAYGYVGTKFKKKYNTWWNVQRRFTERITGINNLEYEQRLMVLKLPSLEYKTEGGYN